MKFLHQMCIIVLFSFLGEVCRAVIPFPIPASIYGMILLFAALMLKIIRVEHVRETGNFLTSLLPLLFVAPTVGLMEYWDLLKPVLLPFSLISLLVTALVVAAAGIVTKLTVKKGAKNDV